ncbi:Uncharacterized protein LOK49_LG15G02053 [Camellia lanceoleosa]|uniref:Uncharacterized protein n=1 Tax=Camellia lanceoleosa TaxID=1840588 RepID=A0ACC0F1N7_9ERIC|nr:Uncharacterized protein LOK49_LG15G02053 [Camellia lanceoleosa]
MAVHNFSVLVCSTMNYYMMPYFTYIFRSQKPQQIEKHGIIIEFTDPDYNTRQSATYLPEVAAHEGQFVTEL